MDSAGSASRPARLAIHHASKTYGSVTVLRDVSLVVEPGEIHGLVGQNGSGKSTLIRLLSGYTAPDPGAELHVDGETVHLPARPRRLAEVGLSFVHQNLGLDLDASVIENVRVGRFRVRPLTRRILWRQEADAVSAVLARLGAEHVNPYATAGSLNHGERASVAIARAIQDIPRGRGCVVFDESTQSLPRDVLDGFMHQVRELAHEGTSVVIVSHRLEEILALCDRVTVLEDGRETVRGHGTAGMTEADLGRLILGESASARTLHTGMLRAPTAVTGPTVLSVVELTGDDISGATLSVRAGEVVGITGPTDSGHRELAETIGGARRATSGEVRVGELRIDPARITPRTAIRAGVALIPHDRAREGLALERGVLENLTLPRLLRGHSRWWLATGWQRREFADVVDQLGLTPPDPAMEAGRLSGGNQQKLLFGKWMLGHPRVLVACEPTQAVDVGARAQLLASLRRDADRGAAVVIASIEAHDLAVVCDRVLVMSAGRVARELTGDQVHPHTILEATYPSGVSDDRP